MPIHSDHNTACTDWRRWMRPGWMKMPEEILSLVYCGLSRDPSIFHWGGIIHVSPPQFGESVLTDVTWHTIAQTIGSGAAHCDPELSDLIERAMIEVEEAVAK